MAEEHRRSTLKYGEHDALATSGDAWFHLKSIHSIMPPEDCYTNLGCTILRKRDIQAGRLFFWTISSHEVI